MGTISDSDLFRITFNTAFLNVGNKITIKRLNISPENLHKKSNMFKKDFMITLFFDDVCKGEFDDKGIMQIKPSTAADRNVGIADISTAENNIHAGAKYMRFLADRYFDDEGITELNQWLLSLAAYNAGPAKVARMRREAREDGHDPNVWFNNVEIIAARRIGRETVTYVSNIFKYYVGYQVISERTGIRSERHAETLQECL